MKLITPEISWHQKEPVYSVHFCPNTWKLATAGADSTIKIWLVKEKEDGDSSVGIEFLSNLERHAKAVNVVRFSPNGSFLATAGDDGTIILWRLNENNRNAAADFGDDEMQNKEDWVVHKMLRGHLEDVYDLDWSPSGSQLISGSVDNTAIVWDIEKGQNMKVLSDHKHYVQGVAWDPRDFYVVTQSSDRSCRLYPTSNHKSLFNVQKNNMFYEKDGKLVKNKYSRMFVDETMQSFFRRCAFSPDGSYLFLPAGLCDGNNPGSDKPSKTTYVFARGQFKKPICHLPGTKKATVCVTCSPVVYELMDKENLPAKTDSNSKALNVPYRMLYAVASLDTVTVYDTQHNFPIGYCANMHYASITDMAWSSDGKLLVVSSKDGYCSFIKFDERELGKPITYDPLKFQIEQVKLRKKNKKENKKESKKADQVPSKKGEQCLKKVDSGNGNDNFPIENNLADATPKEVPVAKEKEKAKQKDSKQPTIDKLFTTPIRKRKRTNDGSPNSVLKVSSDQSKQSPDINAGAMQKQPKRIQVITLDTDDTPAINGGKFGSSKKEMVSPNVNTSAKNSTLSPSTLISPNKIGANLTLPLMNPLVSPNKVPKRVNVTTLVTFPSTNTAKSETLMSPTSTHSKTLKTVTPSKSLSVAASPSVSPSYTIPKQPKRITVQTLETYTEQKSTGLEAEESPISCIPVQVDPPQLDDLTCTNSFDAPLMETVLNNSTFDKSGGQDSVLNISATGLSKADSIILD